ncbi:MAG: hypothetical protein KUG80_08420 [Gammaproteobacteria bacterium]|nr:hypothetical protein [Gammaproteobacteria bacterium]
MIFSNSNSNSNITINFRIPQQNLQALSLTSSKPKEFAQWLSKLSKANAGETARQLHLTVDELGRLKCTTETRFELLELIRPDILELLPQLSKHYLNQPLILSSKAVKVATLAQSLLLRLSTAYKALIVNSLVHIQIAKVKRIIKIASHRLTTLSTLRLLHDYQLYSPAPKSIWHDLYQVYFLSEHYELLEDQIKNKPNEKKTSTIQQEFFRAVMLTVTNPNQLRQIEIGKIYDACDLWSHCISTNSNASPPGMFYLNLLSDSPPAYHNWVATDKDTQIRTIYFGDLVNQLELHLKQPGKASITIPDNLNNDLLSQLCTAWGSSVQRSFSRTPQEGSVEIAVGISAAHYFLADEMTVETFMRNGENEAVSNIESNLFLNPDKNPLAPRAHNETRSSDDVWSIRYTQTPTATTSGADSKTDINTDKISAAITQHSDIQTAAFNTHSCQIIDTSPGGYCLSWQGDTPGQLRTGEILILREQGEKQWAIGVIRWNSQISANTARLGIELLAPSGKACCGSVINKTGPNNRYLRSIQSPELNAVGQPATLITINSGFQEGNKVNLHYLGKTHKAKLTKQISATSGYNQFLFEILDLDKKEQAKNKEKPPSNDSANDEFSNVWSLL